jgi:CO/xanthine dehydrogenase Mo-binding subunit
MDKPLLYVDGAHNPGGWRALRQNIDEYFAGRDLIYICGVFKDKDYEQMLRIMMPGASAFIAVEPDNPRALSRHELKRLAGTYIDEVYEQYVTGKAVELACDKLKKKLCAIAAGMLGCEQDEMYFENGRAYRTGTDQSVSLADISVKDQVANDIAAVATVSHSSPVSPPPYMVGMVEIELDRYTGEVKILDYAAVVDCGIAINPALARVQAEGGIVQGIGHTLFENITYNAKGCPIESSFMQYKIPTRLDMGHLRVEFENSYEPTGPFGAKSIGEIVINTPAPAIAHAIYRATGVWHRELPITPEKILMSMPEE